jgi:hypothetical protein
VDVPLSIWQQFSGTKKWLASQICQVDRPLRRAIFGIGQFLGANRARDCSIHPVRSHSKLGLGRTRRRPAHYQIFLGYQFFQSNTSPPKNVLAFNPSQGQYRANFRKQKDTTVKSSSCYWIIPGPVANYPALCQNRNTRVMADIKH